MLPMLAPEWSTISAIVAAVNPRAANTSVAASRMRCCVASVFAQRRVGVSGSFSPAAPSTESSEGAAVVMRRS
jgi:hypothetical protein